MKEKTSCLITPPVNIIVRMPNWLGDCVMATPILADLKNHFKSAKLTAMCHAGVLPLLSFDPHIDEILSFKRPSGWSHRSRHHNIYASLQKGGYDLGILLTNSFSSAWWFYRGKVKNRIGFSGNLRAPLLTKALSFPKNVEQQHLVYTYKELLTPLGIPVSKTPPKLYVSEKEKLETYNCLKKHGINPDNDIIVGINPGAAFGSAKCWLPDRFREVTKKLLEKDNVHILFFGDRSGTALVEDICCDLPPRVINFAGRTSLCELIALISSCHVFLTNDSGPMHIADALGTPLLALFGSTNDNKTGPYHKDKVIHKHARCSPCYKRVCPIDFRCMKSIEVKEVVDELELILSESEVEKA